MKDFTKLLLKPCAWRDKIAYSVGSLGKDVVQGVISTAIFLYCYQVLGVSTTVIGVVYILQIFISATIAPLIGTLIDNTVKGLGKYKTWVLSGAILNLICLYGFYQIPQTNPSVVIPYAALIYITFTISFVIMDIPYWAMLSVFNSNASLRDSMASVPCVTRNISYFIFYIIGIPTLAGSLDIAPENTSVYLLVALICSAVIFVTQSSFIFFTKSKTSFVSRCENENGKTLGQVNLAKDNNSFNEASASPEDSSNKEINAHAIYGSQHAMSAYAMAERDLRTAEAKHIMSSRFDDMINHLDRHADLSTVAYPSRLTQEFNYANAATNASINQSSAESVSKNEQSVSQSGSASETYRNMNRDTGSYFSAYRSIDPDGTRRNDHVRNYKDDSSLAYESALNGSVSRYATPEPGYFTGDTYADRFTDNNELTKCLDSRMSALKQVITKNDQLLVVFGATLLTQCLIATLFATIMSYSINRNLFSTYEIYAIIIVGGISQIISEIAYERVVHFTSRVIVFNTAIVLVILSFCSLLFAEGSDHFITVLALTVPICNIGIGLCRVAETSMMIDTVDYGEFKFRLRTDGIIFALNSTAKSVGNAIAFIVCGGAILISTFFGSDESLYSLHLSLKASVTAVSVMGLATIFIYYKFYKLNGTFYRNILNNLQYLRQNQQSDANNNQETNRFMLRYSLDESTMIIKLKAKTIDDILRALVQKLSEVNAVTSEHDYMQDLKARLELGPCGIAEGIALPHAKSSAVRRATIVVATLDTPMDLGALDGQPCDLIFLLASPDDGFTHLNLLGRLSLLLNEPGFADRLRACGSSTELFERLIQCEKLIVN